MKQMLNILDILSGVDELHTLVNEVRAHVVWILGGDDQPECRSMYSYKYIPGGK